VAARSPDHFNSFVCFQKTIQRGTSQNRVQFGQFGSESFFGVDEGGAGPGKSQKARTKNVRKRQQPEGPTCSDTSTELQERARYAVQDVVLGYDDLLQGRIRLAYSAQNLPPNDSATADDVLPAFRHVPQRT
jgi:hypothetical protein